MLSRQETLIWDLPSKPYPPQHTMPIANPYKRPQALSNPPSPAASTASSFCSEEEYDGIAQAPNFFLTLPRKHFETWDARPGELLSFSGSFYLASSKMVMRSGAELYFSHFEIEVKTCGRPGRFSRENIWSPAYIDYSSSPTTYKRDDALKRTRQKSAVTWGNRTDHLRNGSVRLTFRAGIPMELFNVMKTRLLRISGRAIFCSRERTQPRAQEIIETNPIVVTMSHLRMAEDMLGMTGWYS